MTWVALLLLIVAATVALLIVHGSDHRPRNDCPDCDEDDLLDCPTCGRIGTGW